VPPTTSAISEASRSTVTPSIVSSPASEPSGLAGQLEDDALGLRDDGSMPPTDR